LRWEVPLALDTNPVSRWSTGQAGERGDYMQIEYTAPIVADSVDVVASIPAVRIDICSAGAWTTVPTHTVDAVELNLRPAAMQLVKQAGITHIVAPAASQGVGVLGERLVNMPDDWNVEVVANLDAAYLLKLR
jgi:hypothetical protein